MAARLAVSLLGISIAFAAVAQSQQPAGKQSLQADQLSQQDLEFMKKAAVGGRLEVELAAC